MQVQARVQRMWRSPPSAALPAIRNGWGEDGSADWRECLASHPDQRFRVGFDYSKSCSRAPRNMASAGTHAHIIREYLAEECAEGHVVGPLDIDQLPNIQISKFGVIPKSSPRGQD